MSIESLPWNEWGEGVRFLTRTRILSDARETSARIGVGIEELPPGKQSCPLHYHLLEEEHVIVLEGAMRLRLGHEELAIKAGDYACFPPGRREGHCFVNSGTETCRYIVIGDHNPNEVCVYPDSQKVMIRGFGRKIMRGGEQLDYWDGERAGEALKR